MTLEHDLLQLARDAMRSLMTGRDFGTGQTGHYLNIISRIEDELAKPEQTIVPFPSFMRKRIEEAIENAINPKGMSTHDGKATVLASDLHRMLLVVDLAAKQLAKQQFYPDWDMLQPYHERIKELEAELAKREQEPFKPDWVSYRQGLVDGAAQPEQEPVAWMVRDQVDGCRYPSALKNPAGSINGESQPLYAAPPRKEWVGLTDDEVDACFEDHGWASSAMYHMVVHAIEAKLKEKNT
jgi:hypothetical protein